MKKLISIMFFMVSFSVMAEETYECNTIHRAQHPAELVLKTGFVTGMVKTVVFKGVNNVNTEFSLKTQEVVAKNIFNYPTITTQPNMDEFATASKLTYVKLKNGANTLEISNTLINKEHVGYINYVYNEPIFNSFASKYFKCERR